MPNSRLTTASPSARSAGGVPSARVPAVQSGVKTPATDTIISAGTPLGLLLALTYAESLTVTSPAEFYSDYRPSVRIINV